MPNLVDTKTGKLVFIPDDMVESALASKTFVFPDEATPLVTDDNTGLEYLADSTPDLDSASLATDQESLERDRSIEYDSTLAASGLGLARGLTVGGSDLIAEGLGYGFEVDQYAQHNPTASTASELVGAIAPAFIPGGQVTAAGALARGSNAIIRGGAGAGRFARAGRAAAAGALEGGAFGFGLSLGEQVRRGEDFSAAASQALNDGLMGAGYGAVGGLAFEAGGSALARLTEPLQRRRVARSVLEDSDFQMDHIRQLTEEANGRRGTLAKDRDALMGVTRELDELKKRGASRELIAEKEVELARISDGISEARSKIKPGGIDKAKQALQKQSEEAKQAIRDELVENVVAIRGAGDHINSMAAKVEDSFGGFFDPATKAAAKKYRETQSRFDDFFRRKSAGDSTAKRGLQEKKVTSKKAGKRAKLENVGEFDVLGKFQGDTAAAMAISKELDQAGLSFARALSDEATQYKAGVRLTVPDEATGLAEVVYEGAQDIDDIVRRSMDVAEGTAKKTAEEITEEAAEEQLKALNVEKGKALDEIKAARKDLKDSSRLEAKRDRLREKIRNNKERIADREALKANSLEGEKYADELKALAEDAGLEITKMDIAAAAVELGVADNPELEWAAHIHLISRIFGQRGVRGIVARLGESKMGSMARGAVDAVIPGASSRIGQAIRRMGVDSVAGKASALGGKINPGKAVKKTVKMGEARATFNARLDKAMRRFSKAKEAAKRAAIVAPHTTLAKMAFAPMSHRGDSDLDPDTRAFERRAKELDSIASDPARLLETARRRVQGRVDADPETQEAMAYELTRKLAWLHSKLPRRRALGRDVERWNSSAREIAKFAKYARYTMDPGAVAEDMANRTLGPEGPEALQATSPQLYERMRLRLVEESHGENMDRDSRVYAGSLFNLPQLDSSLRPSFMAAMSSTSAPPQGQPQQQNPRPLNIQNHKTATERVASR